LRIVCHALTGYYEGRVSVDPESARHVNPLAMSARVVVVKALDAAEAVSQTRLGHHIRDGRASYSNPAKPPRTLRPRVRDNSSRDRSVLLRDWRLMSGDEGNINASRLGFEKTPVWTGRGD